MAKKRRREAKEPEETYEFVPPEFDEKEFLLKDMYGTRVLAVVAVLAVIIGILAGCIQKFASGLWPVGLVLIVLAIIAMKQLLALLGFKAEFLEPKTMIGNYIMFFFLSLGIWIILLNAPFA
ncbi:MAG: hypothetical protein LBV13_05430 [Methanomassiliicoccaceae archaeon]|jgi:hypothetical protein|nr:hypothetical protein [Methanomassiliicoccaceae archaeon]